VAQELVGLADVIVLCVVDEGRLKELLVDLEIGHGLGWLGFCGGGRSGCRFGDGGGCCRWFEFVEAQGYVALGYTFRIGLERMGFKKGFISMEILNKPL